MLFRFQQYWIEYFNEFKKMECDTDTQPTIENKARPENKI